MGRSLPSRPHVTGCASSCGDVAFQRVIHAHAMGVEAPAESADSSLHALDPAARQTVTITLVVEGNHFFAQRPAQILGIARVMDIYVGVRPARPNSKSVHAVVGLSPPAIENRKVQPAI